MLVIEKQTIDGGKSITFGIIEIIFGIGLLRLSKSYSRSASIAGIFNIVDGFFFITVIPNSRCHLCRTGCFSVY
jgi:hypothetical protein